MYSPKHACVSDSGYSNPITKPAHRQHFLTTFCPSRMTRTHSLLELFPNILMNIGSYHPIPVRVLSNVIKVSEPRLENLLVNILTIRFKAVAYFIPFCEGWSLTTCYSGCQCLEATRVLCG